MSSDDKERVRGMTGEWRRRWIETGLRTGPADRDRFEAAARECYRAAQLRWPGEIIWEPSPPALARRVQELGDASVDTAIRRAVVDHVYDAFKDAVDWVRNVDVCGAIADGSDYDTGFRPGYLGGAVCGEVDDALDRIVRLAVSDVLPGDVGPSIVDSCLSGQLGSSHWFDPWRGWGMSAHLWSAACSSYFREVEGVRLSRYLWRRARAYEATVRSACWWRPGTNAVVACERPLEIHRERVRMPGLRSHRLHREDGPAIAWRGFDVWALHGVRVSRQTVEAPETLMAAQVLTEHNVEARRVMIERFGAERLMNEADAVLLDHVHEPRFAGLFDAKLWRLELTGDEPLVMVALQSSTPEPDGSFRQPWLRVPPAVQTAHEAVAWTFRMRGGEYTPA
jgi:hypothetical protein